MVAKQLSCILFLISHFREISSFRLLAPLNQLKSSRLSVTFREFVADHPAVQEKWDKRYDEYLANSDRFQYEEQEEANLMAYLGKMCSHDPNNNIA